MLGQLDLIDTAIKENRLLSLHRDPRTNLADGGLLFFTGHSVLWRRLDFLKSSAENGRSPVVRKPGIFWKWQDHQCDHHDGVVGSVSTARRLPPQACSRLLPLPSACCYFLAYFWLCMAVCASMWRPVAVHGSVRRCVAVEGCV